jgi:hypothetical protein
LNDIGFSRPRGVLRDINEPFAAGVIYPAFAAGVIYPAFAAGVIYPAVLAAWAFLVPLGFQMPISVGMLRR